MSSGARSITDGDELQMTGEFVVTPLKGWDITANYSYFSNNSFAISNSVPIQSTNPDGTVNIALAPSSVSRSLGTNNTHLANIYSSYEKKLGGHAFKVLAGYTGRYYNGLSVSGSNTNLYTDNLPALSLTYGTTPSLSDNLEAYALAGYFGRFNYSFQDKYLLELNGRYDATSKFIYNRWAFFPGMSAGYVLSKEKFWNSIQPYVNSFKIRASYGKSGDQNNVSGNYPFYPGLPTVKATSANWYFGTATQASVSQAGDINPNISWAKPVMLNLGVDMAFLRNRLNVTVEGYRKTIKDLLVGSQPLPAIYGTSAPQINAGEMYTQGFEVTAAWQDRTQLFGKDLKYSFRGVVSNYNGYITKYPNPTKLLTTFYEGQKLGEVWGYQANDLYTDSAMLAGAPKSASFYTGKWALGDVVYLDQNGDSIINVGKNTADSPGDRMVIGNSNPRFSYSFNMDFEYKGFDLSVFIQGVAKKDVFISSNYFFGIADGTSFFQNSVFTSTRDRWTPTNADGYLPKFYMNGTNSRNLQTTTRYLQNAAYLRIKTVQLGYTFPTNWLARAKVQRFRIFASVENLATITKMWEGIDPEIAIGTAKIYPLQQNFAFGINLTL
jgi:TonB-linked SusC/RagA family outer membrane protein